MIPGGVAHLKATRPTDPFEAFAVEFGTSMQAPKGLGVESLQPTTFGETLQKALQEVSDAKTESEHTTFDYATGKNIDVHVMMTQVAKADVLMQLTSTVVSKTATSINQLLQTQI